MAQPRFFALTRWAKRHAKAAHPKSNSFSPSALIDQGLWAWFWIPCLIACVAIDIASSPFVAWRRLLFLRTVERARVEEAQRQALAREEWDRGRPDRERAARETAEREAADRKRKADEQRRRDSVRFKVKLTYDRYASEIKHSLPRKRFDEYLVNELSDQFPADEVERRAAALEAMILDFFEKSDEPRANLTLNQVRTRFADEREKIEQSDFDVVTKEAMMADINLAEDKAIRELRQQ